VGAFSQLVKNLGSARLAIMGAVVVGLLAFFVFMTTRLTGADMELLYADLDSADSNRIVQYLQQQNIEYDMSGNGSQIMVPAGEVGRLRLALAAEGLPGGGSVGYEIFDQSNALGTTNFMQNVNMMRALEGELARTIRSLKAVGGARVHLVLPRRQLFSRERQEATASVILQLRGASQLSREQTAAIQQLVAAAVPELQPNKVSIIDDKGNLLARGAEADSEVTRINDLEERRIAFENRMARRIEELLQKSVGLGKVQARVSAELDFDRISRTEEVYNPDGQVVRSTQTVEESSLANESDGADPVTVATNLPDGNQNNPGGPTSSTRESRTEETTNFEISKTITNHVRETGVIKRLSVAVIVDGISTVNENGEYVYQPREQQEMENLAKLVSTAIGYNEERGDTVEVINMRFAEIEDDFQEPLNLFFGLQKNDLLRIAEFIVLGILVLLVILLVVRPLVARLFEALPAAAAAAEQKLLEEMSSPAPAIAGPADQSEEESEFDELIDIDRVEGRVKASSVKKVGEIVEKHPDEALSIIRNWMYQET